MNPSEQSIDVKAVSTFIEEQSIPDDGRYFFAYTITITNVGAAPAKLLSRHWIITHSSGRVEEVRGDGVVGEQPHLRPGESFEYTSACILETPVGTMHGSYQMVDDAGNPFDASIAPFSFNAGGTLH